MNYTEKYVEILPGDYILTGENDFIDAKEKADEKSETIFKIKSGTKVKVIEATENYTKINISEEVYVPNGNLKKA